MNTHQEIQNCSNDFNEVQQNVLNSIYDVWHSAMSVNIQQYFFSNLHFLDGHSTEFLLINPLVQFLLIHPVAWMANCLNNVLQLDHCLLWDTRAQSRVLSTVDSGLTNLIHDHCSVK